MSKHLVFIGAGHAHLTALANMTRFTGEGHNVTVISASPYHYYSGMGPGMLAGIYNPRETRFNVKRLTESGGGQFINDTVISIDPTKRAIHLRGGNTVEYDVLSLNTGSEIATGAIDASFDTVFKVKPIENLFTARCNLIAALEKGPVQIAVIGGGPAGTEIANTAWRIATEMKANAQITLVSEGKILHRFPAKARKLAMKHMIAKGISVLENTPVKGNTRDTLRLENGREIPFDVAFVATGTKPTNLFKNSGFSVDKDGGLPVNEYLQSQQFPEIFGGGDCIGFVPRPLDKVGVFPVRQNPILLENLYAALSDGKIPLRPFVPQRVYLLILNMGDGTGIFVRKPFIFRGKIAFNIKDRIDRKFMNRFQRSGELHEPVDCRSWGKTAG